MNRRHLALGLLLLLAPPLVRGAWFYQGAYWRRETVRTPDYASLSVPQPPLATEAAPPSSLVSGEKLVLIDQTHLNNFQSGELEPLLRQVTLRGGQVEYLTANDQGLLGPHLAAASALVLAAPSTPYTLDEVRRLEAFVARGGRVLVLTDPTRWTQPFEIYSSSSAMVVLDDSAAANTVLAPFDIAVVDDYLYNLAENEGNFRNVLLTEFAASPLTTGLERVAFYATHSVASPSGLAIIRPAAGTRSSRTDLGGDLAAAVLASNERVLALGDLSFIAPPYDSVADNALLIANLAAFLLGGESSRSPADFPHIFNGPVALYVPGDLELSADLLTALSGLQSQLEETGITLLMAEDTEEAANRIVLATHADGEALDALLTRFEIVLPGAGDDPLAAEPGQIGGWPSLDVLAVGLMLVEREGVHTTLTLIGADAEALTTLVDALASRDFSACVAEEAMAVCAIDSSGSGGFDFDFGSEAIPEADTMLP